MTIAVAPWIFVIMQISPTCNGELSFVAAVHSRPLILIVPFSNSEIGFTTTAFFPISASAFIGVFLTAIFFLKIGRVKINSSKEITVNKISCNQSGNFKRAPKIIKKELAANQIVVKPLVSISITTRTTVIPSQIHGNAV